MNKLINYEKHFWANGQLVLGVDEAGYGCFAGSMFVSGVICDINKEIPVELSKVNDSKKLTEFQRFELEPLIKAFVKHYFCVEVTPNHINKSKNVYWERFSAAENEINIKYKDIILGHTVVYDGNKPLRIDAKFANSLCLEKGDSKSFSIAAASIIAKTAKDREMIAMDKLYPEYGFGKNKGYYCKEHADALKKFGMCEIHRIKYCRNHL